MRKLAMLAGLAGASIMPLMTGQALAFPGGTQSTAARIAPEVQAVQYDEYRYRSYHYHPAPYGSAPYGRQSPDGSPIDSRGWRYFNGYWHSGCFNLSYMSDADACAGAGRR